VVFFTGQQVSAQVETEKRSFDVSEGYAINTLKEAAQQAEVEFIFSADLVKGVRTPSIQGEFTPLEAFSLMLAETSLAVFQHEQSGVYAITKVSDIPILELEQQPIEETEMNTKKNNWFKTLAAVLTLGLAGDLPPLQAQEDEEKVYDLSPFEVEEGTDIGYLATQTLAGTRLKTNLKDVASSITVLTEEFIEDTGSTDIQDYLLYVANAESGGYGGSFIGTTRGAAGNFFTDHSGYLNFNSNQRIRGLAAAGNTRDYFLSNIQSDAYNTERIDILRGPNAILFGLGSPAGIINTTLKSAFYANSNELELRYGSHGTTRSVLDVNRELIKDQLAVRVVGLYEDEKFKQKPAFKRDQRIYIAARYSPDSQFFENSFFDRPEVKVSYESGSIDGNSPRTLTPRETVSAWFDAGKYESDASDNTNNFHNSLGLNGFTAVPDADGNPLIGPMGRNQFFPTLYYAEENDNSPGGAGIPEGMIWKDHALPGVGSVNQLSMNSVAVFDRRLARGGDPRSGFWTTPTMSDSTFFDFRNKLMDGPTKGQEIDFDSVNVSLNQTFFSGRAGIEIAYNEEASQDYNWGLYRDRRAGIMPDINTKLMDGSPNPNFGRPVLGGQARQELHDSDSEATRVTAFLRFDAEERLDGFLGKLLGDHTFTGFYSERETVSDGRGGLLWGTGEDHKAFTRPTDFLGTSIRRQGSVLRYIGPSLADRTSLAGANIPGIQSNVVIPDQATFLVFNPESGNMENRSISIINNRNGQDKLWTSARLDGTETESRAFTWMAKFWDDTIVAMAGWRTDEFVSSSVDAPRDPVLRTRDVNDPSYVLPTQPNGLNFEGDTVTWSLVVHTPRFIEEQLPFLSNISLHYGESENFSPTGARFDWVGNEIAPPTGTTKELGANLSLMEGKFNARLNFYEASQSNNSYNNGINRYVVYQGEGWAMDAVAGNGIEQDPAAVAAYTPPPANIRERWGMVPGPDGLVGNLGGISVPHTTISDNVSEGMELEMIYNPLPNWRMAFNISQQEATEDNQIRLWQQYIEDRIPVWQGPAGNLIIDTGRLNDYMLNEVVIPYQIELQKRGRVVSELREWRWNFITNYQFTEDAPDWLEGFRIGGAARWTDDASIGFRQNTDAAGNPALDINSPIFGDTNLNVDLWVGYETPIFNDRIDWSIQLNVRDAFSDDDLIPFVANPDETVAIWGIPSSTVFELTSRFKF